METGKSAMNAGEGIQSHSAQIDSRRGSCSGRSIVDEMLSEAKERFQSKRPRTRALHSEASRRMPGGNTRSVLYTDPFPIRISHGAGSKIVDVDGHSYVDMLGEYSAGIYGHSHPRIQSAVVEALDIGLCLGAHHDAEVQFSGAVTKRFDLDLVRFTNSGTEANMMAIAAARCFTGRDKVMVMHGAYHGSTLNFAHGQSPMNAPYDIILGEFNKTETTRSLIRSSATDLAAILVEPMMVGSGCLIGSDEFLRMLREESTKYGIMLIFDEVMTSRLHPRGFGAKVGIQPDLKTLGKYIGGGMSFGAFGGCADIMQQFDPARTGALYHAGTFNNNTATMRTGYVALTEIFTPQACVNLNDLGDRLRVEVENLFVQHQINMSPAGVGSLMTIHPRRGEMRVREDVTGIDDRLRQLLFLDLLEKGFYIAARGFIALSLMISEVELAGFVDALSNFARERREAFTEA